MRAFFVLMLCWAVPALALEVEVTGTAPVDGAMSYVREQAMKDALQQASLRVGVQINSTALIAKGTWKDEVELKTSAQVRNDASAGRKPARWPLQRHHSRRSRRIAYVPASKQQYRKAVAVAGFWPNHAGQPGILQNIDKICRVCWWIALITLGACVRLDANRMSLFQEPRQHHRSKRRSSA